MIRRSLPWALLALALAGSSGCRVDDAYLEERLFFCSAPGDCGEDWGCLQGNTYTPSFCAPPCTESCDGACAGDDQALCVRGCLIADDGTAGRCPKDGAECVRTSIERNDGLCYPVQKCATQADCPAGEACLSELVAALGPVRSDNMYCIPTPDLEPCPAGSIPIEFNGPGTQLICLPRCSVTDTRCPPAFACVTQLDQLAAYTTSVEGATCNLGSYGFSCQDDSNCFVGSCLDTGTAQGRVCTLTCNSASRVAGGCDNLIHPLSNTALLWTMECDPGAESEDGSGLCVPRYSINFPGCTQGPDGAFPCRSDLSCQQFGLGVALCTRPCITHAQCNQGRGEMDNWIYQCRSGRCLFAETDE